MGYFDIDGKRYWDIRQLKQLHYKLQPVGRKRCLPSDSVWRKDANTLRTTGDYDLAQEEKEALESLQRHDRKLREAVEKRRKNGGAKFFVPEFDMYKMHLN